MWSQGICHGEKEMEGASYHAKPKMKGEMGSHWRALHNNGRQEPSQMTKWFKPSKLINAVCPNTSAQSSKSHRLDHR